MKSVVSLRRARFIPGAYVLLLAPGKTDYTASHPSKTTTYILHVYTYYLSLRIRTTDASQLETRNEEQLRKRRKKKEKKRKRKKRKGSDEKKEMRRQGKKKKGKTRRGNKERKRETNAILLADPRNSLKTALTNHPYVSAGRPGGVSGYPRAWYRSVS